jgi:hypothetical protein
LPALLLVEMPQAQLPWAPLAPSPKFGSGSATRLLPSALLYVGYIQCPTQLSATRPSVNALPSVFGSMYFDQLANCVIAATTLGLFRLPCAVLPLTAW